MNHKVQNNIRFHLDFHSKAFIKTVDYPPNSYYIIDLSLISEPFSYYWARDKKSKSNFSTCFLLYFSSSWCKAKLMFSGRASWSFSTKYFCTSFSYSAENNQEISVKEMFLSPRVKSPLHDFIAFFALNIIGNNL